jgi:hypothetical protein
LSIEEVGLVDELLRPKARFEAGGIAGGGREAFAEGKTFGSTIAFGISIECAIALGGPPGDG